mmetsp:Transcript_42043/g.84238  ORF Transcript_42043/g.84238 Transcript_42043/m.84238 type:complete len:88 (+) Transcript_42043:82-345(+)
MRALIDAGVVSLCRVTCPLWCTTKQPHGNTDDDSKEKRRPFACANCAALRCFETGRSGEGMSWSVAAAVLSCSVPMKSQFCSASSSF